MEQRSNGEEHILVCISPSPSNPKVISAAAKMAAAFGATLTAIYVKPTNYDTLREKDRLRLQKNIRFAEENGASITITIGNEVASQVAEYAHLSNITKLVIGRSGASKRHFWSKPPLTEQITRNAPNVDIYIIPDSVTDFMEQKERVYPASVYRPTFKDFFITLLILCLVTCIGLIFTRFGFSEANIITVFILGVLVISVFVLSPLYSLLSSLASVLLFNWFFINPRFSFHTYETEYAVTFAIMLISSLITGTLANRLKQNARQAAREAFRTKVLLDTNQLLQKAEKGAEAIEITSRQITTLLNQDVMVYPRRENQEGWEWEKNELGEGICFHPPLFDGEGQEADSNEEEIAQWVFEHQQAAGFRMEMYKEARSQYHAICLNGHCYGVMAIRLNRVSMDPFENSIMLSILGECALAMENLRNAQEKEKASVMVRNEQLRSNLLRSISHDIRTPLTSISGNASNLLSHYRQLDEETLRQIFTDIYDDSEWLIHLVENLLSISRIENGTMELHLSLEVMNDVIEEALKHVDRNIKEHPLRVCNSEDLLFVNMDARLIMQVLMNLINNAIKNTPAGTEICIISEKVGDKAVVSVCDQGPGIPEEVKPHIFEMFYTGVHKVADGRRGLGLGLALCKAIVEAHHGTITLLDNTPSGCRFVLSLSLGDVEMGLMGDA